MRVGSELLKLCKHIEKEIENISDVEEYLNNVLGIQRKQELINGKWETTEYILTVAYGGPSVYIYCYDGIVKASWGLDRYTYPLSDKAKEKLRELGEYLDELFS